MQNKNDQISELTNLNEELENYFSNTIIPQLFVDANLILRKFTPPAMKQFKLEATDVGKPIDEIKENFRFSTFIDNINEVINNGEILEKEVQTVDMQWYQMNILPYRLRNGNGTNGVIITFVDITPRIRDLKELERLIADHELLLDSIAHDIKTPLTSLSLSVQMLKKIPKEDERFSEVLGYLENGVEKTRTIVHDLVQSRWEAHPHRAVEELLDLQNILEDVKLTLAQQLKEANAILREELNVTEVTFARRSLRSVIYNLINNAIKYRSEDRRLEIVISAVVDGDYVVLTVADNGIGIDSAMHEVVFNKFHRIESSLEGNGVGLYLVKEMMLAVGGKIALESELGKGSKFKVFLKRPN